VTAEEIKDALRRRHPGVDPMVKVGRWTCIEEFMGIDLLALDAWQAADVVGYEVKASRGDMRTELLRPWKREKAVAMTTKFYFAVPKDLLTFDELAYTEPDWPDGAFERVPCPWPCRKKTNRARSRAFYGSSGGHKKGMLRVPVPIVGRVERHGLDGSGWTYTKCPNCNGKAYIDKSLVEHEAPTLWVPNDVGLITVDGNGCTEVRRAPRRKTPRLILDMDPTWLGRLNEQTLNRVQRQRINTLVRWVSHRPDPRHVSREDRIGPAHDGRGLDS
jgi:hypothetical protein